MTSVAHLNPQFHDHGGSSCLRRRKIVRFKSNVRCCAQSSASVEESATKESVQLAVKNGGAFQSEELLACPICYNPLSRKGPLGLNQQAISRSAFQCVSCRRTYSTRDVYLDLTITSGSKNYEEVPPTGTELFRNPLVSFVYERGWRQNFQRSGFPGPDEELKMALNYLEPTFGGVLIDVSCGSGLFTRRFAKSGCYQAVVALDFSENMLRQTSEFIKQDQSLRKADIALVRADVSRLPFASGTVDAVHAAAAIHCWPSPSAGVAEICRALKPGGVFVATTFLTNSELSTFLFNGARGSTGMRYWRQEELEEVCVLCGLVDYRKVRRGNFIMLTAKKAI